ncbi:MAG TPA: ATP-binding cassette domain-containing protein [Pseudonocardiaceae bacterium]
MTNGTTGGDGRAAGDRAGATGDPRGRDVGGEGAIVARGLRKRYRGGTEALTGLDLTVRRGTVCGLLGPNGAGKTTAVRVLSTLLRADGGEAWVAGHDVRREPRAVRRRIGLVGQYAAVDEVLTGRQNLVMFGRLNHLPAPRARAGELLERFALTGAADRAASTYSGGMRRRLDLAAGLIVAPDVLFVDEPTTGLDPGGRIEVWDAIRELVGGGTTVLLTTQYLEEADRLADAVVLLDGGRVVAEGTPGELKARVGDDWLEVELADETDAEATTRLAQPHATGVVTRAGTTVRVPVTERAAALVRVAAELHAAGITPADLTVRRPTLDEVFLRLTGRPARSQEVAA